jgi:hypothetical protein
MLTFPDTLLVQVLRGCTGARAAGDSRRKGIFSAAYALSCRYYVEAQERELLGTLETLLAEETWKPADEATGAGVLRSASQLFGEIKKSLVRCSKYITRGPALLQLMATFQVGDASQTNPTPQACAAIFAPD